MAAGKWGKYYARHRDRHIARNRAYYEQNREACRKGQADWYERNKYDLAEQRRLKYKNDPAYAEDMRRRARERYQKLKRQKDGQKDA